MFRSISPILLCGVAAVAQAQVPLPASMQASSGKFTLKADDAIQTNSPVAAKEAEKFAAGLRTSTGLPLTVGTAQARIRIGIDESVKATAGDEGYRLQVTPEQVQLTAATAEGLYHGIQTLRQLLPPAAFSTQKMSGIEWSMGSVKIDDRPRFGWRGFMLDESRHFFGPDYVKHLLDAMAARKLNVFHWHLSDDDGWRIEIKSWPKLTEVGAWRGTECALPNTREGETHKRYGGFYTQEQIKEIVAYAAERHIDIMPELDMPGHCLAVVTAYPETLPGAGDDSVSAQGVKSNVLSPAREENYKMVDDIIGEVAALFPFQFIHVGGDEVNHNAWSKDPAIKALMEREKLGNLSAVQNYFTRRLEGIISKHQRRMVGWNEILGGGNLRPDTTVMAWTGTGPGFEAVKKGHPVIMAPGPYCYFDMGYGGPDEPKTHWWAGNIETSKTYSFDPTAGGNLTPEQQSLIQGAHSALWTEFVSDGEGADYRIFPRLNALAEVAWTPQEKRSWEDFTKRFGNDLERLHYQGIAFRVPPPTALWKQGVAKLVPPFPGAEMHYTTDGTKPAVTSPRYEAVIPISDPNKLRYITVFHGRTSPAKNGAEREGFAKWSPENITADWKAVDFDATAVVTADGIHRALFQFNSGGKKLMIRKVELLRDGKIIATDTHDGESGGKAVNNSYRLPVSSHRNGAKYVLRAEIKGDGGNDSRGGISLDRAEGLEPEMTVAATANGYQDHTTASLVTWNPGAFFWSDRPLKDGDTVTFTFKNPLPLRQVDLPTGEPSGTKDQIQNAVLEVSADGKDFKKVADFSYGSAKATLDGKPVAAIRLRATGAHAGWCIVRLPLLK